MRISSEDIKSRASGAALLRYAPDIVSLGLIVAIAWALARLTWLAVPTADGASRVAAPASVVTAAAPGRTSAVELADKVAAMHLFGQANVAARGDEPVNAPETNLNLTLHGIIAADDPDESRAIIAAGSGSGTAKSYRIGASVPGGATIHGIYADRVILSRNGHLETLKLPRESDSGGSRIVRVAPTPSVAARSSIRPSGRPHPVSPRHVPPRLRHIKALGQMVRAQRAVVNGKLVGYKLYPGSNPAAFLSSGLKPGDVVTEVNGQPLSNPASLMALMAKTGGGKPVSLTVKRDGQTRQIKVSLPSH